MSDLPVWDTQIGFGDAARAELADLFPSETLPLPKQHPEDDAKAVIELLRDHETFGLALSGGGIRSSTFALGVIQRFAELGIISRLHYLSTVSGGGYLGSWLSAWIQRSGDVAAVERALIPPPEPNSPPKEAPQVTWLRNYGKYLAPESSLLSADSWLIATLWARNTLLNLTVLMLLLLSVLTIPWMTIQSDQDFGQMNARSPGSLYLYGMHYALLAMAVFYAIWGGTDRIKSTRFKPPSEFLGLAAAVLVCVSAMFLALSRWTGGWGFTIAYSLISILCMSCMIDWKSGSFVDIVTRIGLAFGINVAVVYGALQVFTGPLFTESAHRLWLRPIILPAAISVLTCTALTFGIGISGRHIPDERREWWSRVAAWMCIIGVVWFLLSGISLVGPSIFDLISRSLALSIASGTLWGAATGIGIWLGRSPKSAPQNPEARSPAIEAILPMLPVVFVGGLLILLSAGLSHILIPRTPCPQCTTERIDVSFSEIWQDVRAGFNADVASEWDGSSEWPYAWGDLLTAEVQHWNHPTLWFGDLDAFAKDLHSNVWGPFRDNISERGFRPSDLAPLPWFCIFLGAFFTLSRLIDVNEFSMHHFYRNRLVRGFQGASNLNRKFEADGFTNLDPNDDVYMTQLRRKAGYTGPVHLVNTAINLNLSNTGLEERKAASFVFTPYACGYGVGSDETGAYQLYPPDCPLRLGTPITASGAAASPQMGYHTSAAVAFLLTVFNVRLGYWIFNTKEPKRSLSRSLLASKPGPLARAIGIFQNMARAASSWQPLGPKIGTAYFIFELLGLASDCRKYVYLSDGGHFENLAVYELLRRRCRFIICVDAEQDEGMKFEGLAGLIRRARADLGCEIKMDTSDIEQRSKEEGWSKSHCAVGTISYKEKRYVRAEHGSNLDEHGPKLDENGQPIEEIGYLLYIKLSVTGDEPTDIINYRKANPAFPHQSTGDQFFNESQFETYRRLGWHAGDHAMRSVDARLFPKYGDNVTPIPLKEVFHDLYNTWYGVPRKISENFSKHTGTLNDMLDELRTEPELGVLHWQLNPELKRTTLLPDAEATKASYYFCQKLILFMETVFFDLDLETNHTHPACEGWMRRFRDWAQSPILEATYRQTEKTYSNQFRMFFSRDVMPRTRQPTGPAA